MARCANVVAVPARSEASAGQSFSSPQPVGCALAKIWPVGPWVKGLLASSSTKKDSTVQHIKKQESQQIEERQGPWTPTAVTRTTATPTRVPPGLEGVLLEPAELVCHLSKSNKDCLFWFVNGRA